MLSTSQLTDAAENNDTGTATCRQTTDAVDVGAGGAHGRRAAGVPGGGGVLQGHNEPRLQVAEETPGQRYR